MSSIFYNKNMKFKLLHISDLHLGLKIKEIDRVNYCKKALLKAINTVKENNLDALVIAGDLFENDKIYREDIEFLIDIFDSIYPTPVIISPGNHDFLEFSCPYNESFLNIMKLKEWSQNVKIFKKPEFSYFSFGDINIYGKPCLSRESQAFDKYININPLKINIAVIHASRTNFCPHEKEIWHPFDDSDVLKSNFDYIALGHYHSYSEISDGLKIKAVYPGSMVPASLYEYDKRGGVIVEIKKENKNISIELEFVELSELSVKRIEISPAQDIEKIKKIISSEISESNNPKNTLFVFKIKGTGNLNILHLKELFSEYKIIFDISEFTKLDIEKLKETSPDTTMGRFINEMLKLIENSYGPEKEILEDALIYGLDAFAGRQIVPRYYEENLS